MQIEYEATFPDIDKDEIRVRLKSAGAKLIKPEFLMKRSVFQLPSGHNIKGGWVRVRDEQDKITLSLKVVDGAKIENQKEICLKVDDFKMAEDLLSTIGCEKKAYQETKRECWELDGVEITIDEWPWLEPFVEIEGKSEATVKAVAEKLSFDYKQAYFGAVDGLYNRKYGTLKDWINNKTPSLIFEGENPFAH